VSVGATDFSTGAAEESRYWCRIELSVIEAVSKFFANFASFAVKSFLKTLNRKVRKRPEGNIPSVLFWELFGIYF
jgi:hypothetical protein